MLSEHEIKHHTYLDHLVNNLIWIGEDKRRVASVIKEPTWLQRGAQHELCDLILLYDDFSATAVELKGSQKRREKALHQISSGKDYIRNILRYDFKYGLFVVYQAPGKYTWERLDPKLLI